MGKCVDAESLYADIEFCQGQKSLPGVRDYAYGIAKKDIVTWPTITREGKSDLGTIPVLTGAFTLAADKTWHRLDLIPDQSDIKTESQGNYGAKTFKVTATLVCPGTEEDITGYIAEANNDKMVYLVPQRNGKFRMIGSEGFTPTLTLSQDTGKSATDANQTTITAEVTDEYPAPFFTGTIKTSAGDISGATGKPVLTGG